MPARAARPPLYHGFRIVAVVSFANFVLYLGVSQGSLAVFNRVLVDEFGWSRGSVATIGSLILFIPAGLVFLIGVACDRFGTRPVFCLGLLLAAVGLLVAGTARSLGQFYVFSAFLAAAEACTGFVPTQVLVSHWFTKRRGFALGMATMGMSLGGIFGPVTVERIVADYGWRAAYLGSATACLFLATPLLFLFLRNRPEDLGLQPEGREARGAAQVAGEGAGLDLRAAVRTRTFWALVVTNTGMFYALYAIAQHWVLLFTDQGIPRATAARMLTVYYGMGVLGRFVWGPLFDRHSSKHVGLLLTTIMAGMVALLTFGSRLPAVPYVYAVGFGFCYGGFTFMVPLLAGEYFGTRHLGRVLGLASTLFAGLSAVSPAVTGFLFDATGSYRLPFLMATAAASVSALALSTVRNEQALLGARGHP